MNLKAVFAGKKVIVSGHTGFKGAWLCIWLNMLGAEVVGIGLDPIHPNGVFSLSNIRKHIADYRVDIRNPESLRRIFQKERPDIVFHLAAQALVLEGYRDPADTFSTNVQGTVNMLDAIRLTPSVQAAVMISTDKCYENREWHYGYRENDTLGGYDPYSASKAAAEIAISSFRRSYFSQAGQHAAVASARAGNVIGGGDWSDFRLIPDLVRALENEQCLEIRNPGAVRPWQHVLEPLGGYLMLASALIAQPERMAEAWNFGPLPQNVLTVEQLIEHFYAYFHRGKWLDTSQPGQAHEAGLLLLDISKAMNVLGWRPVFDIAQTVELTAAWYEQYKQVDVLPFCQDQIEQYNTAWISSKESSMAYSK